ncbi:hypothetical protein [Corynebacterium cystitidis]|nr:hypothetical protein [Corynebacterium cystitidis]
MAFSRTGSGCSPPHEAKEYIDMLRSGVAVDLDDPTVTKEAQR